MQGKPVDDIVKNIFRILCEIMNTPLKTRGTNPVKDDILYEALDTINFSLLDNDLIVLNQLATLKGLANRISFSLTKDQGHALHEAFKSMYHQRRQFIRSKGRGRGNQSGYQTNVKIPKKLNIHELEENRDFRNSAYYHDKYAHVNDP